MENLFGKKWYIWSADFAPNSLFSNGDSVSKYKIELPAISLLSKVLNLYLMMHGSLNLVQATIDMLATIVKNQGD